VGSQGKARHGLTLKPASSTAPPAPRPCWRGW
jgi:hypothetical protein